MKIVPKIRKRRLYAIVAFTILTGILLLYLGAHPGILPRQWVKVVAGVGIVEMICVGLWARKVHHVSVALLLMLFGCVLCFSTMFLPVSEDSKTILLNTGGLLIVLSILTRFLILFRLWAKNP
jgi:hypothetical protein